MSSLAFYAAPIEEAGTAPTTRGGAQTRRGGRKRNATIRKKPDLAKRHVAAMIEHIHQATGTDPSEASQNLADFDPPPRPELQPEAPPAPYAGEDAPVGKSGFVNLVASDAEPGGHVGGAMAKEAHARDFTARGLQREGFTPPYYSDMGDASGRDEHYPLVGGREQLLKKLDYMIYLLEEQRDERTGHVAEEVVLYSFLGIFVIFMADSFARAGKDVR